MDRKMLVTPCSPDLYKQTRVCAALEGVSMAEYNRRLIERSNLEVLARKGVEVDAATKQSQLQPA